MKRGEIWTVAGGGSYTGKPRPAVIIQDDNFSETGSVTICPATSNTIEAPLMRIRVEPDGTNGLRAPTRFMADKVTTVERARLGKRVGRLDPSDLKRLASAIFVFLGLGAGGV